MGRKKVLEKRMARLNAKRDSLKEKALASENADEVRAINDQLAELSEEISETQEEIDAIAEEERAASEAVAEIRDFPPENAQRVNDGIVSSFSQQTNSTQQRSNEDPYGTLEYRQAFQRYVQSGTAIPANLVRRAADGIGPVNTTDLGAIIPTTILNEFIKDVSKVYGQIYSKVRKLSIKGGVKVPISDLSASFKWINEGTVSPRQDAGEIKQFVEFSYNIGEIRVSQTLISSIVALELFESEVTRIMVEAYVEAMDKGIVSGSGNGQMLGFLKDPRVTRQTGHIIEMTEAEFNNWTAWRKKLFAKLPLKKRSGEFIFPLSTVETYLETMADANNNPIFKQAAGAEVAEGDGSTNGRFFGREITLVEPDIIPDFDTAQAGDVVGVYWTPNDYAINTNLTFGMKRYFDDDKNEWVNKALTIVDGKMLDVSGMYLIKKKA